MFVSKDIEVSAMNVLPQSNLSSHLNLNSHRVGSLVGRVWSGANIQEAPVCLSWTQTCIFAAAED